MAEQCHSCGTEVFEGQRFCRACGTPVGRYTTSELPTEIIQGQRGAADTVALSNKGTDPFPAAQPTAHQTAYDSRLKPDYAPPPRTDARRSWLITSAALGLILAALLGIFLYARSLPTAKQSTRITSVTLPPQPSAQPVPNQPAGTVLDESGAETSDEETVITRRYPLGVAATFTLNNPNGRVTVEGWDEREALVQITKRGGSSEDRRRVEVFYESTSARLSFETPRSQGSPVEVQYEVKLPRRLRQVEIKSMNSGIKLEDVEAAVTVRNMNGPIELSGVTGATTARTNNGEIRVSLARVSEDAPQEYSAVNGNIEVEFDSDVEALINAQTTSGNIEFDPDDFNLKVEKRMPGEVVTGLLGKGGAPVSISTVHGNISLSK